jgi:Aminotransferase class-V/Iron-sulfur cluster assembly protein
MQYLSSKAQSMPGLRIIGQAQDKIPVLSFLLEDTHPSDVATLLGQLGIAVRVGHHCAMPLMQRYNIPGTVRASFSFYNTMEEIDVLFASLARIKRILVAPEPVAIPAPATDHLEARSIPTNPHPVNAKAVREAIIATLRTIYHPEIPVNIYDLGLIYEIVLDDQGLAKIKMTLSAPGSPVAPLRASRSRSKSC